MHTYRVFRVSVSYSHVDSDLVASLHSILLNRVDYDDNLQEDADNLTGNNPGNEKFFGVRQNSKNLRKKSAFFMQEE